MTGTTGTTVMAGTARSRTTAQRGGGTCGVARTSRTRRQQSGGDYGSGTPLPWQNFNGKLELNTQATNANNYGRLSAQGVGSPTAGYGYSTTATQSGGDFEGLWGTNEPTFNYMSEPNYNTVYGDMQGGCPCDQDGGGSGGHMPHTRSTVIESIAKATGDTPANVRRTVSRVHGRKSRFSDEDIAKAVRAHLSGATTQTAKKKRPLDGNLHTTRGHPENHPRNAGHTPNFAILGQNPLVHGT